MRFYQFQASWPLIATSLGMVDRKASSLRRAYPGMSRLLALIGGKLTRVCLTLGFLCPSRFLTGKAGLFSDHGNCLCALGRVLQASTLTCFSTRADREIPRRVYGEASFGCIPGRHNLHMLSLTNLAHLCPTHDDIVSSRPGPPGPVFEHPLRHIYTIPSFGILGNGRHEGYEACFFCPPVSASLNDR
jgi:hypothetical protein